MSEKSHGEEEETSGDVSSDDSETTGDVHIEQETIQSSDNEPELTMDQSSSRSDHESDFVRSDHESDSASSRHSDEDLTIYVEAMGVQDELLELMDEIINLRDELESDEEDEVEGQPEGNDDDEEEDVMPAIPLQELEEERGFVGIDYDTALPIRHSYLPNSNEIGARQYSYWTEGESVHQLPVISIDSVIISPGQIVPLRLRDHNGALLIRRLLGENKNTFGVVLPEEKVTRGVTVQILEISNEAEELCLKAIGRQRFKISTFSQQNLWSAHADVVIMSDVTLVSANKSFDHLMLKDGSKLSRLTQWPDWLYKLHDTQQIMALIRDEIRDGSPHVNLTTAPQDPLMFSFWLVQAMPFALEKRVELLKEDNVISRLHEQLKLLQNIHSLYFTCSSCHNRHYIIIGRCSQVFSMSVDGPSASYVNPHGFLHETVTLYSVMETVSQGTPTSQDSWFPGYSWNYIHCSRCDSHLGWKFSATEGSQRPQCFYGVRRAQVNILDKNESQV